MYNFVMPAEDWDELHPNKQAILHLILKHRSEAERLEKLERYYKGEHDILNEKDRENRLVCNHAKDISDTASSYFIGNPVSYKSEEDITVLTDELENAGADEADGDNGLDLSIYGRAYEYIYTKQDETDLNIKNLPPKNTFVVIDNSIEENELFAVYYWAKKDDTDRKTIKYVATVLTENYKYVLNILNRDEPQDLTEEPEKHYKGEVPVIEYRNNKLGIGDFELQIPLIDAYNVLMSDRVTDKEQFIDAILMVYGTLLGDPQEDEKENNHEDDTPMKRLHKEKMMEMPSDSRAEYLTRTFDENGVEILKKAIEQDIHKFSHIPCMSDESFGGNVSGVAMEFKLLGMENITKIKSRYYKKGLRKRLRIFVNFLQMRSCTMVNATAITPVFTRALPKNLLEISQYVANLWGKVSKRTLLAQIPFVDNVDEELQAVEKEEQESIEKQQKLFGNNVNEPPDLEDDDKEVDDE
ncbi:phage portal protein [Ruminococcus sp.]|uniref:phage portal protein n=1 Tax=Ruminococcus sp. TaxID=41978 RepID=UPI003529007B